MLSSNISSVTIVVWNLNNHTIGQVSAIMADHFYRPEHEFLSALRNEKIIRFDYLDRFELAKTCEAMRKFCGVLCTVEPIIETIERR